MENWIKEDWFKMTLAGISVIILVVIIAIINKNQKKVKLVKAKKALLEKEEAERLQKQKLQAEIDTKLNSILERRKQIEEQFEWLDGMNKEIEIRKNKNSH